MEPVKRMEDPPNRSTQRFLVSKAGPRRENRTPASAERASFAADDGDMTRRATLRRLAMNLRASPRADRGSAQRAGECHRARRSYRVAADAMGVSARRARGCSKQASKLDAKTFAPSARVRTAVTGMANRPLPPLRPLSFLGGRATRWAMAPGVYCRADSRHPECDEPWPRSRFRLRYSETQKADPWWVGFAIAPRTAAVEHDLKWLTISRASPAGTAGGSWCAKRSSGG